MRSLSYEDACLGSDDSGTWHIIQWGYYRKLEKLQDAVVLAFLKNKYRSLKKAGALKGPWFFCTVQEMEHWLGISKKTQKLIVDRLIGSEIVLSELKGVPPKRHFRFDWEKLYNVEGMEPGKNLLLAEIPQSDPTFGEESEPKTAPLKGKETSPLKGKEASPLKGKEASPIIKRNTPKRNTIKKGSKEPLPVDEQLSRPNEIPLAENNSPSESPQGDTLKPKISSDRPKDSLTPKSDSTTPSGHQKSKLVPDGTSPRVPKDILQRILLMSPVFSKMKIDDPPSKVFLRTEKILHQIKGGTFLTQHKWKSGWMGEKLEGFKRFPRSQNDSGYMKWADVVETIQESINAWTAAMEGGMDWPKARPNGTRAPISLDTFLLNQAPGGTTSPFLGFFLGAQSGRMVIRGQKTKDQLPKRVGNLGQLILDTRLEDNGRAWGPIGMSKWWTGISELMLWRTLNADRIMECDVEGGNARHLCGPVEFMKLIHIFFAGSDPVIGSVMYPQWEFIGPDKEGWKAFSKWARVNFGVTLTLSDLNARIKASRNVSHNTEDHNRAEIREQVIKEQQAEGFQLGRDFTEADLETVVTQRMSEE